MINEGGPGSGPQGNGGSSSSNSTDNKKPKVLAHWDYKGPQYTSGVKVPKPSSPNYRQVWKGESQENATVSNGPIVMSTYPLAKSGTLLTYPPQGKPNSNIIETIGSALTLGGKLSTSYPHDPMSHVSTTEAAGARVGQSLTIGGKLSPKYPHSPTEVSSGSMFPGVER